MKQVDSSASMAALVPGRFRMKVRAVISRNATSRQSPGTRPVTIGVNALPNRLWRDRRNRPGFCRQQIREKLEQVPDGSLRRPSICLVLLELREAEATGAGPFPGLFTCAQKS